VKLKKKIINKTQEKKLNNNNLKIKCMLRWIEILYVLWFGDFFCK
jgi:hypothetical protein